MALTLADMKHLDRVVAAIRKVSGVHNIERMMKV